MNTPRVRRRPSMRVARRGAAAPAQAGTIPPNYRRTRAAVGLAILILVFSGAWLLNGSFTVDLVVLLGGSILWGWSLHFTNSALEVLPVFLAPFLRGLVIPRGVLVVIWVASLPFGIFDVLGSTMGVSPWFVWTGTTGVFQHLQNVALAELIAFLPEPMLIWLFLALYTVLRSRP